MEGQISSDRPGVIALLHKIGADKRHLGKLDDVEPIGAFKILVTRRKLIGFSSIVPVYTIVTPISLMKISRKAKLGQAVGIYCTEYFPAAGRLRPPAGFLRHLASGSDGGKVLLPDIIPGALIERRLLRQVNASYHDRMPRAFPDDKARSGSDRNGRTDRSR